MTLTEKNRLAQELHDGIAQDLVGVGYSLDLILSDLTTQIETRTAVRKVRLDVTELLEKVRIEIHDLRQIDESSFESRLLITVENICDEVSVDLVLPELPLDLSDEVSFQVLRIVRELLRNVIKHADATRVFFSLGTDLEEGSIVIRDNGCAAPTYGARSFGLAGSQGRAQSIGGSLNWKLEANGSTAMLRFPLQLKSS